MKQKYELILPARRRKHQEKLPHLANDIRNMANIVYEELHPITRERMAVKHFITALESPAAQYELSQRKFDSLDNALEAAQLREMYYGVESPWENSNRNKGMKLQKEKAESNNTNHPIKADNSKKSDNWTPTCRHCRGPHPSYICQPCRHCQGPHFDNKCPQLQEN